MNSQYTETHPKILVVDDEALVRSTIEKYLSKVGYNVETAEDGNVAIQKLEKNSYDLVLTDLKMPNLDGRELLKYMAEKYHGTPKIVLTGYGEDFDILVALKSGASDFLFKPLGDFGILEHAVKKALEIKIINDDKNRYLEQLKHINEIISLLNSGKNTEEIFKMLSYSLKNAIPFNYISLIQIDRINSRLIIKLIESDREQTIKEGFLIPIDLNSLDQNPTYKNKFIINNINEFIAPEKKILEILSVIIESLKKEGFKSFLILPLIVNNEIKGFLDLCSEAVGFFQKNHISFMESIVGHIALSMQRGELLNNLEVHTKHLEQLVELRTNEILKTQRTTLFALSKLAEVRDHETGEHLERIRRYTILTAQIYKYTDNKSNITNIFLRDLYDSSILHDIGKVGIPDAILRKNGPLTPEEYDIIKTHIHIGHNALKSASKDLGENSFFKMAMDIILYHHEHWDGSGYPYGLKGEEIPLAARIISISDVYDALVSKRPYKDAYSHEESVEIMKKSALFFDPVLFQIFLDNAEEYDLIRKQFIDK